MSALHKCYDIPNLNTPPKGLVFVRTSKQEYLPTDCTEFVGISMIRADNEYCGWQIGLGRFSGGEQLIARGIWSSTANWLSWKTIISLI